MADAIPVSRKAAPKSPAEQAAADQVSVELANTPGATDDPELQALAQAGRAAGKMVIEYPKMVRVDN